MNATTRVLKGRGSASNPHGRFDTTTHERCDDGWAEECPAPSRALKELLPELARTIIARNSSPDVPFSQSINPYRGCEHGCIYCYARPTHAYLDLSPGLDFETRIRFKQNAPELLEREFEQPRYRCEPIAIGANTDPYQPAEAELGITRRLLDVCLKHSHPVSLITKSALVLRDADLLEALAQRRLCHVYISVTTLDDALKRQLEPRTASGGARLRAVAELAGRGIAVGVMVAPVIPMINDAEIEVILERAVASGARRASWILLRLPHEVRDLFREWLATHYPERAAHVMSLIRQSREGRENDPRFGSRMRGSGPFADLIARRFSVAARRLGLNDFEWPALDTRQFVPARQEKPQLQLF